MPERPWVPWKRWWTPLGGPIHLEQPGGFLTDPSSEFAHLYPLNVFPLEDLLHRRCLILCGDPGMGKTTELDELQKRLAGAHNAPQVLRVNFRSCLDAADFPNKVFGSAIWKRWQRSDSSLRLIIDGVDEGLWLAPNFLEWFIEELGSGVPLGRLSVVLACRTLEWPQALGRQLSALWGEPRHNDQKPAGSVFELCPLTRSAVVQAATAHSAPPTDFLNAVHERQVHGLAARPLTLFMLLDEFGDRGGNLTRTHRQLYLDFCRRLCDEPDPLRARRLRRRNVAWVNYRGSQKQTVAGRIAAMMFLSAKSSVVVSNTSNASSTDLSVAEVASGRENDGTEDFCVTDDLVEATLATGLFNAKGDSRFGFEHQTFAECLAAQYLAKIDFGPLRTLLLRRDDAGEYVVPQLAELASWLAGEREDIFDLLLATQPEILLRTDLTHLGDHRKEQVVDALIRKAVDAELFERHKERRPFYAALAHPRLADQLRSTILDRRKNDVARWLALDIASACKCRELFPALLTILKRGSDPVSRQAGYALDDLVDDSSASRLIPIADGTFVPQQSRSVRVTALRALVSTRWSVSDALPVAKSIAGSVDFIDHYLADRVRREDVASGLEVIAGCNGVFDSLFRLRKVAMRLLEMAADRLDEEEILRVVTTIVLAGLKSYQLRVWADAGAFGKAVQGNASKRRLIVRALLRRSASAGNSMRWQIATLCLPEDVPWLLDCAESSDPPERDAYFELIAPLLQPELICPYWDEIVSRVQQSPALRQVAEWFTPWRLNAKTARRARSEYRKREAARKRHEAEMQKQKLPDRTRFTEKLLREARSGKPDTWIRLSRGLFITDTREWADGVAPHDIERSPGWIAATEARRDDIRQVARQFLLRGDAEFVRNPDQTTYGADAAFAAAWLLRADLAVAGPLQDVFAKRCVRAIAWYFHGEDAAAELMTVLYPLNPQRCREVYVEQLEFDGARHAGITHAPRPFVKCWDSALTKVTERFLIAKTRRAETIRSVMRELARVDLPAIPRIWRRLAFPGAKRGRPGILRAAAASELMLELFAAEYWEELFPFLEANRDVTRIVILRSDPLRSGHDVNPTGELTEQQLSSLYLLLYTIFSPADPEEQWGDDGEPREVTARLDAGRYRDLLVDQLVARGTPAACNEMRRIVDNVSRDHRLWMKKRWLDCVELVRRKAWNPIAPEQLLEIARRRNAYWIEDENDLVLVSLESLDELQRSISNSPSGDVLDFWEYKRRGARLVEHHPKSELDVARKLYAWLRERLGAKHGAIIHREVTVQWDQRRTDIEIVVAADPQQRRREVAVVLEVKRAWNAGVRLDAKRQLRDRYLKRTGRTRGIYIVAWFECDVWRPARRFLRSRTVASARNEVAAICQRATKPPIVILPYVVDCSLPT